jgi:hypothetical protein
MTLPFSLPHRLAVFLGAAVLFLFSVSGHAAAPSAADPLLRWNTVALDAIRLARNPPPIASLHLATYHAALFDTLNSHDPRYAPWLVATRAPADSDPQAALASAAHTVLRALWGDAANPQLFEEAYAAALARVPAGPARDAGVAWGRQVAEQVLAARAAAIPPPPATPVVWASDAPGRWRETPPGFRPAVLPWMARVKPFALREPAQFRPGPPPALDSADYARELAQVARIGPRDGAERTADETQTTLFWSDDLGTATPAGHWNVIAQDLLAASQPTLLEAAREFALLNFALADAAIACWDAKYHYLTWRPETALRELTPALNPHFTPHPNFIPLMTSPAHPDYVSGHSTYSAAAARVLARLLGRDEIAFSTTSDGLPGVVRQFRSLSQARDEIGMSRIFGGIHTMSANVAGQRTGEQVADWVLAQMLPPR